MVACFTPSSHAQYAEGVGTLRKDGGDLGGQRSPDNDIIGALCARDSKTVGNQFVNEGKVIPCLKSPCA